jgi:hypothetical protein
VGTAAAGYRRSSIEYSARPRPGIMLHVRDDDDPRAARAMI